MGSCCALTQDQPEGATRPLHLKRNHPVSVIPVPNSMLLLLCFSLSLYAVVESSTPAPISVDDTSSLLHYSDINHWTTHVNVPPSPWHLYGNSDTFSDVQGAWVSFEFNGTDIQYWGNQGPYHGPCRVTLDDGTSEVVSSNYDVDAVPILLFSKSNLAGNQTHKIKVTVVNNSYPNVCEIDRFVYTPFAKKSSSSVKFIAIGAGVGAFVLLLLLFGIVFFWKRRSRRTIHIGPGILDDDLFTSEFSTQPTMTSPLETSFAGMPTTPEFSQRPLSSTTGPLSHSSSIASKSDMLTSALPTPFPLAPFAPSQYPQTPSAKFQPPPTHMPVPHPTMQQQQQQQQQQPQFLSQQTYSDQSSSEKMGSTFPADTATTSYSGEGSSSSPFHPMVVHNQSRVSTASAPQSPPVSPTHPSSPPQPVIQPVASGSVPYQHEDAGRVPEEIPPAYKDSWSPPS